jgi:serine/threonine-protein kinase
MSENRDEVRGTLVLGRYRIVQALARGGMGVVYLARTEGAAGFSRPVVVKRIIPDLAGDEATGQSFVREARILANLQHPGIVNVIDFDEEDGAYVMVLEYVDGYNIGQWHRYVLDARGQMPVDHALYIVTRVLDALHYAHTFVRADGTAMQIVHRDVSPGNVLIDTQGHIKLLDFGIARANEGDEYKTRDGMFKGKLSYSAPEVYDGRVAKPTSDVYSAAVVLHQLLSGENPFKGKDVAEIVRRVLIETPRLIGPMRSDVSPELDAVLQSALAKDPALRPPTASAFADQLRSVRPHREEEFLTDLVDDVWNDFHGDMPARLGLETLTARDTAWRTSAESTAITSAVPASLETVRFEGIEPVKGDATTLLGRESRRKARLPWIVAGVLGVGAAAAGVYAATARREPDAASRFVVVEKQSRDDAPATPQPEAVTPVAAATVATVTSVTPVAASSEVAEPGGTAHLTKTALVEPARPAGPDAASLSRTVQKQRGGIESCFQTHVKEMDGRPEVSVRFRVAPTGRVASADLFPATLSSTPLGQCLLGVARGIDFGPQQAEVSFTIPITARRVR